MDRQLAGVLLALVGAVVLVVGVRSERRRKKLILDGYEILCRVVDTKERSHGDADGVYTDWYVRVIPGDAPDQRPVWVEVPERTYRSVHIDDSIGLYRSPGLRRKLVHGQLPGGLSQYIIIIGGLVLIVGIAALLGVGESG